MRRVRLGQPANDKDVRWIFNSLREIELASEEEVEQIADDYTITNLTETRTLDCDTATLAQLCDVVGTFINDLKNRGRR